MQTRFMRWAAVVADLGSPFYLEERQRDVWNEASAVGFQSMVWLSFAGATASLWIGGRTALPYAVVMAAIATVASWVTIGYARLLGVAAVQPGTRQWLSMRRLALFTVIYLLFLGGLARATWTMGPASIRSGFLAGLPVGFVVAVVLGIRALRAADRPQPDEPDVLSDDVPSS